MCTETFNLWYLILQLFIWVAMTATFIVYFYQLKTMKSGSEGQNILSLVNFLQAQYVRDARTRVRQQLRNKKYEDWNEDDRRAADLVCSTYDIAAILMLQEKLVPKKPFIQNWGPSIRDCYQILKHHIKEMQKIENSGNEYWNDFEKLYNEVNKNA